MKVLPLGEGGCRLTCEGCGAEFIVPVTAAQPTHVCVPNLTAPNAAGAP